MIAMTHLTQAQHLQLIENRGEIGLFGGQASYRGDIAPDKFQLNKRYIILKSYNIIYIILKWMSTIGLS